MKFEGLNTNEALPNAELTPAELLLLRTQMQMALAFTKLPDATEKEEEAIISSRLLKNREKFNIVFDELLKNTPKLLKLWSEDSNSLLETIQNRIDLIPKLPEKVKEWKEENEEERVAA
ncbi:MAG: hypothetical protein M3Q24_01925 [bacterium]|nr:hypothetical protein [bacterium]